MRDVNAVIKEVPVWQGQDLQTELLNGGLTNHTYKVITQDRTYVLRINGQQSLHMKLDPKQEALAITKAHEMGIAPKVWHVGEAGDYLVTEFMPGELVDVADSHKPEMIRLIGQTLALAHTITGVERHCSPFDIIERQIDGIRQLGAALPPQMSGYLSRMDEIRRRDTQGLTNSSTLTCYCHNDAYHINMLYDSTNHSITLIDWELSGYGHPYLDLGVFPYVADYNEEEERLLLVTYLNLQDPSDVTQRQLECLHDMRFIGLLREVAWALLQLALPETSVNTEFDFNWFANHCMSRIDGGHLSVW